jgi:hypothetical protein
MVPSCKSSSGNTRAILLNLLSYSFHAEPEFVDVQGTKESIAMNQFRQTMQWPGGLAGTSNRVVIPARQARIDFLGSLKVQKNEIFLAPILNFVLLQS